VQLRRVLDQFDAVDVMMVTRLDRQRAAPRHVEHAPGDDRQGQPGRSAGSTWELPPKLTPAQQAEARRRRAQGATLVELARSYNVGISTIRRATRAA
jgi:hypothetical protein